MSKYDVDLDYAFPKIDISEEELNEIITEADKIISENKVNTEELATAYLKKAQCLQKLDQWVRWMFPGAIYYSGNPEYKIKELLEKALELSPDMPEALMRLGTEYCNIHQLDDDHIDEALNLFDRAIQLKPDYAAAFNNRIHCYKCSTDFFMVSGKEDEQDEQDKDEIEKAKTNSMKAIADLTEAIRIRPFDAMYYYNRGGYYSDLKMHEKAVDDYSSVLKYGSDAFKKECPIFLQRGQEYMEIKEYGKAVEDFSELLRLEPHNDNTRVIFGRDIHGDILLLRGKTYYLAGEKDKAKADFEKYLKRRRDDADVKCREEIHKQIGVNPEDF